MFYLIEIDLSIELLFLLNISGAESAKKNEALAVQLKTQIDLDNYDTCLFQTFSNVMSRNLLVPYFDWAKAINKET